MSDQGSVSTDDTPKDDAPMNVVTEENEGAVQVPPDATRAAPPAGEPNEGKSADPESEKSDGQPPKKRRQRSAERKIGRLTRELEEAKQAGAQRDAQITALQAEIAELKKGAAAPPPKKPRLQDFKNAEEFGAAWAEWERANAEPPPAEPPAAQPPASDPNSPPQPPAEPPPEVAELEEAGEKVYGEEFSEVLHDKTLPLSANMADYIFDSDKGPDIVMWLDEHREEAKELFHLRPRALAKKLDELVPTLETPEPPAPTPERDASGKFVAKQPPEPPPPPPGDPVRGAPSETSREIKEGLSMDDYAARRRAQEKAHRVR